MKYKAGDWVQLTSTPKAHWHHPSSMSKYLGAEVRLAIDVYSGDHWVKFEGDDGWYFNEGDIAGYAKNKIVHDILQDL